MTIAPALTPSDLADLFPGPVIVTELSAADVVAALDTERSFLLAKPGGECVVIQPLHSDKDRELLRQQMQRIADRQQP
jgi:hypothetical protein